MSPPKAAFRLSLLLLALTLAGCVDDKSLLKQVHDYFPDATVHKFDPRVLWIQTEVDGISGKFAEKTFDAFLQEMESQAQQKSLGFVHLSDALAHDGYVFLVLGFRKGIIVWDRRSNLRWTLTWPQARTWFTENLGYYPKQEQTEIVREPSANQANARVQGTVPAETDIIVTLDQSVSSKNALTGEAVVGSVAGGVAVGNTVIPKGSKAMLSVASVQSSGSFGGVPRLWLKIDSVEVNGKTYAVSSRWSGQTRQGDDIVFPPGTKLGFTLRSALTIQ